MKLHRGQGAHISVRCFDQPVPSGWFYPLLVQANLGPQGQPYALTALLRLSWQICRDPPPPPSTLLKSIAVGPTKSQIHPSGTHRLSPLEMSQDSQYAWPCLLDPQLRLSGLREKPSSGSISYPLCRQTAGNRLSDSRHTSNKAPDRPALHLVA